MEEISTINNDLIHYTPDYKEKKQNSDMLKEKQTCESIDKKEVKMRINYEQEYYDYLIKKGYSLNTAFSYSSSVGRVIRYENIGDWQGIVSKINLLIKEYDFGGAKEEYGAIGKRTVINALKRFDEFLIEKDYKYMNEQLEPNPEPEPRCPITDDKLDKLLNILNHENVLLKQFIDDCIDMAIEKGTTDIQKWFYSYGGFKFRGGPLLTIMGASWFVSYKYYNMIDRTHLNWKRVNTTYRTEVFNITGKYHEEWLKKVLYMNSDYLSTAKIGLKGIEIKQMAQLLLKKLDNN